MLNGYNTNIQFKGRDYHVQTEDCGPKDSVVVTQLYHRGAVIFSDKTDYSRFTDNPDFEKELRNMMRKQHKDVIRNLIKGKYETG